MVKPYQPPAETAWPAAKRMPVWQTLLAAFVVLPGLLALAAIYAGFAAAVAVSVYRMVMGR